MKKIIVLIIAFVFSYKSNAQGFEGGYMMPEFSKLTPFTEVNIVGKEIFCRDYAPYQRVDAPILSKNEALTLAMLLTKDPKELGLKRDTGSVIRSKGGYVAIFYSHIKKTWVLDFKTMMDIPCTEKKPLRFFFLK